MASETDSTGAFLISTFFVGETLMGIDTMRVEEIIKLVDMTRVHKAPDYIVGIINLRGKIVTIVDLARKLELAQLTETDDTRIIIVGWKDEYVGFLVSRVCDVVSAERSNLSKPPANIRELQGRFLEGVYESGKHLIAIIDVDKLLSETEKT